MVLPRLTMVGLKLLPRCLLARDELLHGALVLCASQRLTAKEFAQLADVRLPGRGLFPNRCSELLQFAEGRMVSLHRFVLALRVHQLLLQARYALSNRGMLRRTRILLQIVVLPQLAVIGFK